MSTKFQKVLSVFALSAVAATWFFGAKSSLADDENHQSATVSEVTTQFEQGAENLTRTKSPTVHLSEWNCYDGTEVKEHAPFLYSTLSRSNIGLFTLHSLKDNDTRVCTAPREVYEETWGEQSGAIYDPSVNIAFFSKMNPGPYIVMHEIAHANKAAATKDISNRLLEKGKYTSFVVSKLADEAGSIALQVISAYNDHLKGNSSQYLKYLSYGSESPMGDMAQVLDQLTKEKPALGAISALPCLQFPAEDMDKLLATYLKHKAQEPYIYYAFSDAKNTYDGVYGAPPSSDFEAPRISPSEASLLTLGTMYKNETEFPLAAQALEELGKNLSPIMRAKLPFINSDTEFEKMTGAFVKTLSDEKKTTPSLYQNKTNPSLLNKLLTIK